MSTSIALLAAPAMASAAFLHTVTPGESLTSIAAADGLSVSQLAAANGLAPDAQLIAGSTVAIPAQTGPVASAPSIASPVSANVSQTGDGDGDGDDAGLQATGDDAGPSATAAPAGTGAPVSAGSYVVQPGDTLTAIAARAGTSVDELAASNGIDPNGVLVSGAVIVLGPATTAASVPAQAPAVGTTVSGRMTWFGGPHDPNAQGIPASGLGWRSDGMAYFNRGSLRGRWLMHFPWGQSMSMTQIDIGPAPWTGNPFDIAYSALPNTPYSWRDWPNATVTGTYEGP